MAYSSVLTGLDASRAYKSSKALAAKPTRVDLTPKREIKGPSFTDMVAKKAQSTIATIRAGEVAQIRGLHGELSQQAVIEATMQMESAVSMSVAVRDKLVEAYQEVLRMAV